MIAFNAIESYARKGVFAEAAALAALLLLLVLAGCGGAENEDKPKKKAPLVAVETVTAGEIVRSIDLTAEVVPIETVQISSTVEGPIGFCPWREGDRVEAGQKLIEIDREMYRAEVKAADAALTVARAKLDDLKAGTRPEEIDKAGESVREAAQSAKFEQRDLERIAQLVDTGALPGEDLDKGRVKQVAAEAKLNAAHRQLEMLEAGFTRTAIAVQDAAVNEAAAKQELAQARLNECAIVAPFAGTIIKVFVRQGDMAAMKAPLLEMADLSSLVVRCAVPEANAAETRRGMKAQVRLDALPGKTLPAEIARVFPELDSRMRTRTIELVIRDSVELVPGMFGRVRLILESVRDAVVVPIQAVVITPTGASVVFVAVDGKAGQRKVQTGIEEAGRIQVVLGLNPGDKLIVTGHEKLKDGMHIRLPGARAEGQPKGKPGAARSGDGPNKPKEGDR